MIDKDELWRQLANVTQLRIAEDRVNWSIYAIFWGANAILLVALVRDVPNERPGLTVVVAAVGFLLSISWHLIQRRAIGHLERLEHLAEIIERRLGIPPEFAISAAIDVQGWRRHVGGPSGLVRNLMRVTSLLAFLAWLVYLLILGILGIPYMCLKIVP